MTSRHQDLFNSITNEFNEDLFQVEVKIKQNPLTDVLQHMMLCVKEHSVTIDAIPETYATKVYVEQLYGAVRRSVESMLQSKFAELDNFMKEVREHVINVDEKLNQFALEQTRFEKIVEFRLQQMEKEQEIQYKDTMSLYNRSKAMVQELGMKHENAILRTSNLYSLFSLSEGEVNRLLQVKSETPRLTRSTQTSLSGVTDGATQSGLETDELSSVASNLSMEWEDVQKLKLLQRSPIFAVMSKQIAQKTDKSETALVQKDVDKLERRFSNMRTDLEDKIDSAVSDRTEEAIKRHVVPLRAEVMSALDSKANMDEMILQLNSKAEKEELEQKADHHQMMRMYAQLFDDVKDKFKTLKDWSKEISVAIDKRATKEELQEVSVKVDLATELEEQNQVSSLRYRCLVCGNAEPKFSRLKSFSEEELAELVKERSSRQSTPRGITPRVFTPRSSLQERTALNRNMTNTSPPHTRPLTAPNGSKLQFHNVDQLAQGGKRTNIQVEIPTEPLPPSRSISESSRARALISTTSEGRTVLQGRPPPNDRSSSLMKFLNTISHTSSEQLPRISAQE